MSLPLHPWLWLVLLLSFEDDQDGRLIYENACTLTLVQAPCTEEPGVQRVWLRNHRKKPAEWLTKGDTRFPRSRADEFPDLYVAN